MQEALISAEIPTGRVHSPVWGQPRIPRDAPKPTHTPYSHSVLRAIERVCIFQMLCKAMEMIPKTHGQLGEDQAEPVAAIHHAAQPCARRLHHFFARYLPCQHAAEANRYNKKAFGKTPGASAGIFLSRLMGGEKINK